jgi:hypothetical protein
MTGSFLHGLARNQVSRDCQELCVTGVILVFWTVWSGRERIMSNSYSSERGSRRPRCRRVWQGTSRHCRRSPVSSWSGRVGRGSS